MVIGLFVHVFSGYGYSSLHTRSYSELFGK